VASHTALGFGRERVDSIGNDVADDDHGVPSFTGLPALCIL
jgi:hypothetical protein